MKKGDKKKRVRLVVCLHLPRWRRISLPSQIVVVLMYVWPVAICPRLMLHYHPIVLSRFKKIIYPFYPRCCLLLPDRQMDWLAYRMQLLYIHSTVPPTACRCPCHLLHLNSSSSLSLLPSFQVPSLVCFNNVSPSSCLSVDLSLFLPP